VIYGILERLARSLKESRRPRLSRRKLYAGGKGRTVHALHENWPSSIVDHGNDAGPMIAIRFRFGSGHHLRAAAKVMTFLSASCAETLAAVSNASPRVIPNIIDLRITFST
jgi:hypothetical protein